MQGLSGRDLGGILELLATIDGAASVDDFGQRLAGGIRELIRCDFASYNEVDPVQRRAVFVVDPAEAVFDGSQELFAEHLGDHPLVAHYHQVGLPDALMLSDFVTLRSFQQTGLYQEVFKPTGTSWILSIAFEVGAGLPMVALALHRDGADFSERDRALLLALRPHLSAAHRVAEERQLLVHLEAAAAHGRQHVVVLGRDGVARKVSPSARLLLERRFGVLDAEGGPLPEGLAADLFAATPAGRSPIAEQAIPALASVECAGARIVSRVVARDATRVVVELEERPTGVPVESLCALGLTSRQAEVLAHVARGLTNRQIGTALRLSPLTVKKHLEHIYARLGASGRAAAAALAVAAAGSSESW